MKLLHSLIQREIVRSYSAKDKQVNLDFVIEALKCHKDDKHDVQGLDSEADVPPFSCSFNKSLLRGNMLAVADEEGSVSLYDVRKQGPSAKLKGWLAHSNAIFDIAWVCDEPKLVTASGDQTAQLWDVQQSTRLAVFKGHSCSLKSVDFQDENLFVFATGARDGNVMVWDIRCNKRDGYYQPVNTIHNCHSTLAAGTPQRNRRRGRRLSNVATPNSQQSVTSVKFQDVNTVISAGAVDGNIKVWDLRKNYSTIRNKPQPSHVFPYPGSGTRTHGYSSLTLDSNKSKLFANCTNDIIYMYDCITFQKHPLTSFRGHSNETFYIKSSVSPDDQYLMSGSGDCDGYIWRIEDPDAAPFHLTGHTNEVTSVAWCPSDQSKVITCSDDNSLKVWRVNYGEKNNGDFIGWCERKPNPSVETKVVEVPNKTTALASSPNRSRSTSAPSSPVAQSPNPSKCSSPQQFLQNWLQSNSPSNKAKPNSSDNSSCHKRQREVENTVNTNKRVCLEKIMEQNEDVKNSSTLCNVKTVFNKDTNKENVNNVNTRVNSEQSFKSTVLSEKCNTEHNDIGSSSKQSTNQSECKNVVTKVTKSNWLRDMGIKKKSLNKTSRKVNPPSQPSSPLSQEPSSPNRELGTVLRNMRSITDYFSPLSSDEDSPSKYCLR